MNDMHCQYKILIADGGKDIELEKYLINTNNYPNLFYEYIRYPFDISIKQFHSKLINVLKYVKTKYLLLADNDDFFLLKRIPHLINFLDLNPDYIASRGQLVNLTLFSNNGVINSPIGFDYIAKRQTSFSISDNLINKRISNLCNNISLYDYYANWYCIFHTKIFLEARCQLSKITDPLIDEILTHAFLLTKGKIYIENTPFYIRQTNTSMFGDILVIENKILENFIKFNSLEELNKGANLLIKLNSGLNYENLIKSFSVYLQILTSLHRLVFLVIRGLEAEVYILLIASDQQSQPPK